jgi:chromosome partitioning protein
MMTQDRVVQPETFESPQAFKKVIQSLFQKEGWEVFQPPLNAVGFDLEVVKNWESIAVQIKNHKAKVNLGQIERFRHFLESSKASHFAGGFLVSASGFSQAAVTHILTDQTTRIRLGTYYDGQILWAGEETNSELVNNEISELMYIGVFTCKGGVGKTTIAAHLAGAFALMGYEVILIDLDPEGNLKKLLADGVYIPAPNGGEGANISVIHRDEWDERQYPEVKIVICDCSPTLERNPEEFLRKFRYCIIPTTLNPLGLNKHANVIIRTFNEVRKVNDTAEMFVLINNYYADEEKRNSRLNNILKREINNYSAIDPKCKYIDPEFAAIRFSKQLLYWGYHIVENSQSELAFREIAGRSNPRIDFLKLVNYLQDHTSIEDLRNSGQD